MDLTTAFCLVVMTAIIVGGWLMSKEIDLRKPVPPPPQPHAPISDTQHAISELSVILSRLQDAYESDGDDEVLKEIGKINDTLASIATKASGTMCKCSGKNV